MNVRTRLAAATTAAALALPANATAAPAPGPPPAVPGGTQVAFQPTRRTNSGARVVPNRPLRSYRGPWLRLRTAPVGANAVDPALGLAPDGTAYVAVTAFHGGVYEGRAQVRRSADGGRTWRVTRERVPPPQLVLSPSLHVDRTTGRVFVVDVNGGCPIVASSDGGAWSDAVACNPSAGTSPTVVSGPAPAGAYAPTWRGGYVYLCAGSTAATTCHHSFDGGVTFLPQGAPAYAPADDETAELCRPAAGRAVVAPNGHLLMPLSACGHPWLAVSEDAGLTWRRSRVSDIVAADGVTAVAADAAGNHYYVWWDARQRLPYLAISRDGGLTWNRPMLLAPPGVASVNFPSIEVGAPGRVAVTFPGTTGLSGADRPWNYYVLTSTDALAESPTFVAATANAVRDPVFRGSCTSSCGHVGRRVPVAVSGAGEVWSAFADGCTEEAGCTDPSRRGEAVSHRAYVVRQVSGPRLR